VSGWRNDLARTAGRQELVCELLENLLPARLMAMARWSICWPAPWSRRPPTEMAQWRL